jgi:hypothetical protein
VRAERADGNGKRAHHASQKNEGSFHMHMID